MQGYHQEVGDWILGRTLGSGTTGKVKYATHKVTGQEVAIKIIKKTQFDVKPDLQRKIRREVALMRLIDHPHLMKLVEVCESQRHLYMVLEFCAHGELFDFLVARRRLEPELALRIFRELIYGLEYLHAHAICHRDLKPENILLDEFDHVKIADFGFARWMRSNIAETSCGSPHYAAPEVIRGLHYDGRAADVWSCGVILYALLAGRLPFDDPSVRTLLAKVKSGKYVMPDFPEEIQSLISRMLEVDVEKRITIEEIKMHPVFRIGLPDTYITPSPLPIPMMNEPMDQDLVDEGLLTVLRGIGYDSDEEIYAELMSSEHTHAKVFYEMFNGEIAVASLPWQEDVEVYQAPDEEFWQSPKLIGGGSGMSDSMFGKQKVFMSPDVSSPGSSLAQRSNWGVGSMLEAQEHPEHTFLDINLPLVVLMTTLQKFLTEREFKWFHHNDSGIICKIPGDEFYVCFRAMFEQEDLIKMTATLLNGDLGNFNSLVMELQMELDEARSYFMGEE